MYYAILHLPHPTLDEEMTRKKSTKLFQVSWMVLPVPGILEGPS